MAIASDPVKENVSKILEEWSSCFLKYSQSHPGIPLPPKFLDIFTLDWPCKPHRDADNAYRIDYRSPSETKPMDTASFSLQARLYVYSETGVRSYYVDEDGIIRATAENRPANKNDAPIPTCEWKVGTPCLSN